MRKPLLFLVITLFWCIDAVVSVPVSECPSKLPKTCSCEVLESGIRVKCSRSSILTEIFDSIKNETIETLAILNCEPKIRELAPLPFLKVQRLIIESCGIEKIDADAFKNLGPHLEELRLSGNLLTTLPLLGVLPQLHTINFKNNLVSL